MAQSNRQAYDIGHGDPEKANLLQHRKARSNYWALAMKIALGSTLLVFLAVGTVVSGSDLNVFDDLSKDELCVGQLTAETIIEIRSLKPVVDQILEHITVTEKGETWRQLAAFVDKHGPRFAGTTHLERAIDDRVAYLGEIVGGSQARVEDFEVPLWTRGDTDVVLLDAWEGGRNKTFGVLSLGNSVGTPNGDPLVAEAIVVRSFKELQAKSPSEVQGKVVVYNQPFVNYSTTVKYRTYGASEAAAKGAVAALIRSVTNHSLYTPHTGVMQYDPKYNKIPAISITVEDAELMWRKQERGEKLRVSVRSTARLADEKGITRNIIAELKGDQQPEEVVIVSGHIDSWDVGQGAMDDGGGAAVSWRVLEVLKKLNLSPARTIRTVLFSAEEIGIFGGKAYFKQHKSEKNNVQFIMECDLGTFTPLGLSSPTKNLQTRCILLEALALLKSINATRLLHSDDGPDIFQWFDLGVPGGSLYNDNPRYFDYHHTNADMVSMLSPDELDRVTCVWTAMAYVLAQISVRLKHDNSLITV